MRRKLAITILTLAAACLTVIAITISANHFKPDYTDDSYLIVRGRPSTSANQFNYRTNIETTKQAADGSDVTVTVYFDYGFNTPQYRSLSEVNEIITSYLDAFQAIFDDASYDELYAENGIIDLLVQCQEVVAASERNWIGFRFYISSIHTPDLSPLPFSRTDFAAANWPNSAEPAE